MFSSCSAFIPSFTSAVILRVTFLIVREAFPSLSVVAPDLIPFLPLAVMLIVPVPSIVTFEPSLHFITAFSAFSLSVQVSSLLFSESVRLFVVPAAAMILTSVLLLHEIGAVSELVRLRPSRTRVTPVVSFFILIEPSLQLPETI